MSDARWPDCATGWHDRCSQPARCGCPCHTKGRGSATPPKRAVVATDADALRDALRIHHPIMRSETGPFSGCRCGEVKLGQDVIGHVVDQLRAAEPPQAVVDAVANARLAGLKVSGQTIALATEVAVGRLTVDEAVDLTLRNYALLGRIEALVGEFEERWQASGRDEWSMAAWALRDLLRGARS